MLGPKEVEVLRHAGLVEGLAGETLDVSRRDPRACRDGAEPQLGQQAAQLVSLVALGLGHAEDCEEPLVVALGSRPSEDAPVPFEQHVAGPLGECVARETVPLLGDQEAALLQP